MRRKDKEMTDRDEIALVVAKCRHCHLAMCDAGEPYVVPMNFGHSYQDSVLTLYFHGAKMGRKIDILKKNPRVCFEMLVDHGILEAAEACDYGWTFECVVGAGAVRFLEEPADKIHALGRIMRQQTGRDDFTFPDRMLAGTAVYAVEAEWFTGKRKLPG